MLRSGVSATSQVGTADTCMDISLLSHTFSLRALFKGLKQFWHPLTMLHTSCRDPLTNPTDFI